jgi:hypothetical protein
MTASWRRDLAMGSDDTEPASPTGRGGAA